MRVISGFLRGRRLDARKGRAIRPTSGYLREVLFDILGDRVQNSNFLDLFAGTGAIGIEAISRGARLVTFVEASPFCIRLIRENLKRLCVLGAGELIRGEALRVLESLKAQGRTYSLVYLDPPYRGTLVEEALIALSSGTLLENGGLVVVEHFHKKGLPEEIGCLRRLRECRHGQTKLSFYGKP